MAKTTQTESPLTEFEFDGDKVEFFGIKPETNTTEEIIKEVKGQKGATSLKEVNTKEEEEDENETEEVTFFEEEKPKPSKKDKPPKTEVKEDEDEEDDDETKEEVEDEKKGKDGKKVASTKKEGEAEEEEEEELTEEEKDAKFFTTLADEMKEKGIFQNIEIPKDKDLTEEEFFELQDKEIEARVEETFEAFFEEMDEDSKDFLRFKKAGGKTADFFATYGTGFDLDELDVEDEDQRTRVLSHYLTTVEKLDAEELKDRLTYLKEGGKDKAFATKYFTKLKESEKEQKESLKTKADEAEAARIENTKKFSTELKKVLAKTDAVGVFSITKEDQKILDSYILKPSIKVGKNKYIPEFNVALGKVLNPKTEADVQKLLVLGKLLQKDFDTKDIATKVETKVTKSAKAKLQAAKNGVKLTTAGSYSKKSLADFLE